MCQGINKIEGGEGGCASLANQYFQAWAAEQTQKMEPLASPIDIDNEHGSRGF